MKGKTTFISFLNWFRKFLFWLSTSIAVVLVLLMLALQLPYFQKLAADQVLNYISLNTRQITSLEGIKIQWFDQVEVRKVKIKDYQGNTMIRAERVEANYEFNRLLKDGNLWFDVVFLEDAELNLKNYPDSLNLNLVEFIKDLNALNTRPKDSTRVPPQLKIGEIHLDQLVFSYDNKRNDSLPDHLFDYRHFMLDIPGGHFTDFLVWSDTIRASIRSLAARDPSTGLTIESLESDFELSNRGIYFDNLDLKTPQSHITNQLKMHYSNIGALSDFVEQVELDISLEESIISKKDIEYFATIPLNDFQAKVSGRISGTIPHLSFSDLKLGFGQKSEIFGNIDFMGLPSIDETFIDARIREASVASSDLVVFNQEAARQTRSLGRVDFTGRFLGFVNDFVANGDFQTAIGNISSDINLKFPKGWDNVRYSGSLRLKQFDVGKLIEAPSKVGVVNMKGSLNGQGITVQNAKFYLDAKLWKSEIFNYQYEAIEANGDFATSFFNGTLHVQDTNCTVSARGSIDLTHQPEVINITTEVKALHLQELGFTEDETNISGRFKADLTSLNFDSLEGSIRADTLLVRWKGENLKIDSALVNSERLKNYRFIRAQLPDLDLQVDGDFYFSQIIRDAKIVADELGQYFDPDRNNKLVFSHQFPEEYTIDFDLRYDDINEYLKLLVPADLFVAPHGEVSGTYFQRTNATLTLYTEIDSIFFKDVGYSGNTLDINLSKDLDSAGIIASVFAYSENQIWTNNPPTKNLSVEAVWFNDHITFNSHVEQPQNNSSADINGELKFSKNRLTFKFLPSRLIAFGDQWFFNPYNRVTYSRNGVDIDGLEIYQNTQSILLEGHYSDSAETNLQLTVQNFEMKTLETLLPEKLGGVLNASVEMSKSDPIQPFKVNSSLNIDDFELNSLPVGQVTGESNWDADANGLMLDFEVNRAGVNTIDIHGVYHPKAEESEQLDIEATFSQASLQILEPFTKGFASNVKGYADGEVILSGSLSYPVLRGSTSVHEGQFTFDYLGTTYSVNGDLNFDNNIINLDDIMLRDIKNDQARLSGSISHVGFKNFALNLDIRADEFQFLNTSASDNKLYYGVANGSGQISITGPLQDLLIRAQATTEKGTKLYIPLSTETEVSQKDYISFVNFNDTTNVLNIEEVVKKSISGVRLDFDIDVTPDAYVELIFNIKTGDIIRGRGNGNLNMLLDTNGDFELFGDLSITEGAYNFTIPAIGISKEFNVVPGSTISWYGDPYSGNLDLKATYRQLAALDNYYGSTEDNISQKFPILVVLDLQGDMLSPQIDFEIELEDSQSSVSSSVQREISTINNNEQQLKRQVFSLLILRKLSPRDSYLSAGGGSAIGGSVSEFLSNQFSYFISQMDENLEIDVDLNSLDMDGLNTFQLRLSYTFLDGRLRVSGGGGLPQNANNSNTTSTSDYLGDWSVQYLLTPDGHLRVRAFSQTEQITNNTQRETGMSFQYVKSFDDLKELFSSTRKQGFQNQKSNEIN